MNFLRVKSITEAWDFLIDEVYNVNKGEFRIHTNKDGLRLYLRFKNEKFTGRIYQYFTSFGFKYHKDLRIEVESIYCDTLVAKDLVSVLNLHLDQMSGNILEDDEYVLRQYSDISKEMTPEEFIYQDLSERNQLANYEERLVKLKEIYKF